MRTELCAAIGAALSCPTRVDILKLITAERVCLSQLAARVGVSPSAVSYHLGILRAAGLVEVKARGRHRIARTTMRGSCGGTRITALIDALLS